MTTALTTMRADKVQVRAIEWLDKPLLQGSAFTLIAGPKGVGKGTWIAAVTAGMTRGVYGPVRDVLIISTEDSASIDLVPRLNAAGADLTHVHIITGPLSLPADLHRLHDLTVETGNVGMVVIDPLSNHMGGVDTDKEGAVRYAIQGLNKLADELACVILGVRHIGKARQNGAVAAVLGSTAWVDLPRAVLMFAPDDEDTTLFHVQVVAGNRSGHGAGETYRIELRDGGSGGDPVTYASSVGASTKNIDELLSAPRATSRSEDARELILDILDKEGEQESDALDARVARESGLAAQTIKNQRVKLKTAGFIRNVPVKDDDGTVVQWKVTRTKAQRP